MTLASAMHHNELGRSMKSSLAAVAFVVTVGCGSQERPVLRTDMNQEDAIQLLQDKSMAKELKDLPCVTARAKDGSEVVVHLVNPTLREPNQGKFRLYVAKTGSVDQGRYYEDPRTALVAAVSIGVGRFQECEGFVE